MKITLILLLCVFCCLIYAENFQYVAPEFVHSFYDSYSFNYVGAKAAGKGYTGVAQPGNISNTLLNPATLLTSSPRFYMEYLIKGNSEEFNTQNDQTYKSYVPSGLIGFSISPAKSYFIGLSYSCTNSLKYDKFKRTISTGENIYRYPGFTKSQITGSLCYQYEKFSFGLNLDVDFYRFHDYRIIWSLERVNFTDEVFRFQPGFLYNSDNWSIGCSYKPETTADFKCSPDNTTYLDQYESYETTLPSELNVGFTFNLLNVQWALDTTYEQTSSQADEFDDRLKIKFGVEKDAISYIVRAGFIHNPGIFEGTYDIPIFGNDDQQFPDSYEADSTGVINKLNQNMLTAGVTVPSNFGYLHMALISDIFGDTDLIQFNFAMDFRLDYIGKLFE